MRDITGYNGRYTVSYLGNVYSSAQTALRMLRPASNGAGYLQVPLHNSGKVKRFYVHRLVWVAFNGVIPEGYEVDHKDRDRSNNDLSNLQLLTRSDNMAKCLEDNPHIMGNLINNNYRP
jgi:hypothetical protein